MRDPPQPSTIKTSAPSLNGVIARPRVLKALSQLPAASKWLQAPSGTGKSTLAASYARTSGRPFAWYRLDERDNDAVYFYKQLAAALQAQLRWTAPLPNFSADDHARHQEFARRYVGALAAQVVHPTLIVLDDVQSLSAAPMLGALVELVEVTSERLEVLFISQSIAPPEFFDVIAARRMMLLNDVDLNFDAGECKALMAAMRVDSTQTDDITALTGGHAGALVLACELLRGTDARSDLAIKTVERIHQHLLSKLIERMPPPRRKLLLDTAFALQLTRPLAITLAGSDSAEHMDALVESGLLRRVGTDGAETFEAHGLVRQGIQMLVTARLGSPKATALAEFTATALIESGQSDAAFALLVQIDSTARAIKLLEGLAHQYAVHGQTEMLLGSIAKVPIESARANAWLCFWTGQALLHVNEEQARKWLGDAHTAFAGARDSHGMRIAAASIVTAHGLECGDFRDLDLWIERHSAAGGDLPVDPDDSFETTLIMGIICAAFVNGRYPPRIEPEAVIDRLRALLDREDAWLSEDQRVQGARVLIEHGMVFGNFELARSAAFATRHLIDAGRGSALHRGRWLIAAAYAYFFRGDMAAALPYLNQAQSLARQSQSSGLAFEMGFALCDYWMKANDLQRADDEMALLESVAARAVPAQRAQFARMKGRLLLLQERLTEGLRWAEEARRMALPAGFSKAYLRVFDMDLVYALVANERLPEAIACMAQLEFEPIEQRVAVEHCVRFLAAPEELSLLRSGLGAAAQLNFVTLLERARAPLARICEAALSNDVETDFVLRLITVRQLSPPPLAGPRWPWAVHVRTLGGFRLDIGSKRYKPAHKSQDKPLELLKLLVTCQALGRELPEKTWITERLWPEANIENARKSLDMTVGRLRRLLGADEIVSSNEGRLELSRQHVWTDIGMLLDGLSRIRRLRDEYVTGRPAPMHAASISVKALLEHYTGEYLANEDSPPWILAGRQAIAAAVRETLSTAESILGDTADDLLIPALEKAFGADQTSEDLARALMRAYLRRGSSSETLRVYRRLREMLSLQLGVAPSRETDDIRAQAYASDTASLQKQSVD